MTTILVSGDWLYYPRTRGAMPGHRDPDALGRDRLPCLAAGQGYSREVARRTASARVLSRDRHLERIAYFAAVARKVLEDVLQEDPMWYEVLARIRGE